MKLTWAIFLPIALGVFTFTFGINVFPEIIGSMITNMFVIILIAGIAYIPTDQLIIWISENGLLQTFLGL